MSPSFASCLLESQAEPYMSSLASAPSATPLPPSSTTTLRHRPLLDAHGPSSLAGLFSSFLCCRNIPVPSPFIPERTPRHCPSPRVSLTVSTCVRVRSRLFMVSPRPAFGLQHTGVSGMAAFYSDRIVHNLNTPLLTNAQHKQLERGPLGNGICPVPYL